MSYPRAVVISWSVAVLLLIGACQAFAGVFIEAQSGASYLHKTVPDGLWEQTAFGTSYQGIKLACGGRIGYRFKAPYSIQVGYTSFGTARLETNAVADQCYNPLSHTVTCGTQAMHLKTADTYRGYTASVTRYVGLGQDFSLPLSLGAALVTHRLRTDDTAQPANIQERYGRLPMGSLAIGVCYKDILCWENTAYIALQGQQYHDPVSTQIFTSTIGLRYHFAG